MSHSRGSAKPFRISDPVRDVLSELPMELRSVLMVEDDAVMREMLQDLLGGESFAVEVAESADAALDRLRERDYGVVLSDIRMPGRSGIEMLGELREVRPRTPVVMMTGFGSIDSAVEAMRAGAFDYVTKPCHREGLVVALERALEHRALEEENRQLRRAVDRTTSFGELIGASAAMREIFGLIRKISSSQSNVLVTGESGTGKEVVARTIHFTGARSRGSFVPVNCAAIPEGLLESELFGHVRGAFTGAVNSKRGLFEEAAGGTIFLDEIGDMGPGLQGKLLRVLQDREVRPVGGNQSVKVDVRVIAATHRDLGAEMEAGRFRPDLYYRLNVIPIHIPPLRERPEDLELLAQSFLRKHAAGRPLRLSGAALDLLKQRRWEGNARELENWVERVAQLVDGDSIGPDEVTLLDGTRTRGDATSAKGLLAFALGQRMTLRDLENWYISEALRAMGGNKVQAARLLGINRRTLYRREDRAAGPEPSFGEESS